MWGLFAATIGTAQPLIESMQSFAFLLGEYEVISMRPDGKGGWSEAGKGQASFYPILEGTFVRQEVTTKLGNASLTMNNTFGIDGRSGQMRLLALDREYSTMDVYHGTINDQSLVFSNLESDTPARTPDGTPISFRLSYQSISDSENQLTVELTTDEGKTWQPYARNRFLRKSKGSGNSYRIQFLPDRVRIEGSFQECAPVLAQFVGSCTEVAEGQQALIRNLRISVQGQEYTPTSTELGRWEVEELANDSRQSMDIRYEVLLDFDQYTWNSGEEEMAFSTERGWVFSMRSLFLWPLDKYDIEEPVHLSFDVPENQRVITPWNLDAPEAKQVVVPDFVEFLFNTFLVGNYATTLYELEGLSLHVAYLEATKKHELLFEEVLAQSISYYQNQIGTKTNESYLVIYSEGKRNDGGAFENSFSQTIYGSINKASQPIWGGLTAHELSHLWNGRDITFSGTQEEWLVEGVADYLSILALSNSGALPPEAILDKLENSIRKYLIAHYVLSPGVSLSEGGTNKGQHRMLLYGGGALVSLIMDMELRSGSEGNASFFALWQKLFQKRKEGSFTNQQVLNLATEDCSEIRTIFDQYVYGTERFPLEEICQNLGLQLDVFGYEDVQLTITTDQHGLRKSIFGF